MKRVYGLLVIAAIVAMGSFVVWQNVPNRANNRVLSHEDRSSIPSAQQKQKANDLTPSRLRKTDEDREPSEPSALGSLLETRGLSVDERVSRLQKMRGSGLIEDERERALAFLGGQQWPEGMPVASVHWLADELLTVLRQQEPAQKNLPEALTKTAFQAETDPIIRDYIMQHLGHLWEQHGTSREIEDALWQAISTSDETTPGTALIALSRGYSRDQNEKSLVKLRQKALELAENPNTKLAARASALAIAGEGADEKVGQLAVDLLKNPDTPLILRKVAERLAK